MTTLLFLIGFFITNETQIIKAMIAVNSWVLTWTLAPSKQVMHSKMTEIKQQK